MTELYTDRLLLRAIEMTDAADIYEYSKEQSVGPWAGWKPHEALKETKKLIKKIFLKADCTWGIVIKDTNKLVGSIGLIPDASRPSEKIRMLGYAMGSKYWGKGYMSEAAVRVLDYAFGAIELDMVTVTCYPDNERSRRVIEKCGFTYEGRLRLHLKHYDGEMRDGLVFSLLKNEFDPDILKKR